MYSMFSVVIQCKNHLLNTIFEKQKSFLLLPDGIKGVFEGALETNDTLHRLVTDIKKSTVISAFGWIHFESPKFYELTYITILKKEFSTIQNTSLD